MPLNSPARRYASIQARRGREWYVQIRASLHALRTQHVEPRTIWVNQATADDMYALWCEVCLVQGERRPRFDGVLPSIAGVPVRVGMTGGDDYTFEYHDTRADDYAMRDVVDRVYKVQDNPLDGTH